MTRKGKEKRFFVFIGEDGKPMGKPQEIVKTKVAPRCVGKRKAVIKEFVFGKDSYGVKRGPKP